MKKIALISLVTIWIIALIILIFSLTDVLPESPLKEYRQITGLGFIAVSGLIGLLWNRIVKS
jgi:hypothetical protein